jgi:hypothetical protein
MPTPADIERNNRVCAERHHPGGPNAPVFVDLSAPG